MSGRPIIGLIGHRDLTGFGEQAELSVKLRHVFRALAAEGRARGLICGYATGADQLAVTVWNALGLPTPRLVFPFALAADQGPLFHTDDPAKATLATVFTQDALAKVGVPCLPDNGIGHAAQAATILARADLLVAVVDLAREALPGGTVQTVARARALGKEVIIIGPDFRGKGGD